MTLRRLWLGIWCAGALAQSALSAQPASSCERWPSPDFFRSASVADVSACLEHGADATEVREGDTPLHVALDAHRGPAVIEVLLAAGADVNARDARNRTPLRRALDSGVPLGTIRVLLGAGADVNARDDLGWTPLHEAVRNDATSVIGVLLDAGADVNVRNRGGATLLHMAFDRSPAMFEMLREAGADLNARDASGRTLLHYAAQRNGATMIASLLESGANGAVRDEMGQTPLHWAASDQEELPAFELLLATGVDVNVQDAQGRTPLFVAAQRHAMPEVVERLLTAGADMHAVDNSGRTMLHAAASNEHLEFIESLLAAGVDVNARDANGRTPLHAAAQSSGWVDYEGWFWIGRTRPRTPRYGSPGVVEMLLAAGAAVNARDNTGRTPLHETWRNRNPAVIEALVAAGADASAQDDGGRTAADSGMRIVQIREFLEADPPQASPPAASLRQVEGLRDCPLCPELVLVPGGTFRMGCLAPAWEGCREDAEKPTHVVDVTAFALSKYEVTRGQFEAFAAATGHDLRGGCVGAENGSWRNQSWQSDDHPVVCVSWNDAQSYARWPSSETGREYRLPSESEWEYAARAGTVTKWFWGDQDQERCGYANGRGDYGCDDAWKQTAPVGSFGANGFGVHDMIGNVWEWVADCWHDDYEGAPDDGLAWTRGGDCGRRVLRGGSWLSSDGLLRSARRHGSHAGYRSVNRGFRVVRTPQ